jgi:hypothetical protein
MVECILEKIKWKNMRERHKFLSLRKYSDFGSLFLKNDTKIDINFTYGAVIYILVDYINKKICGYLSREDVKDTKNKKYAYSIGGIYTRTSFDPDYKGTGRTLIEAVKTDAKKNGKKFIFIDASTEEGFGFYTHLGFVPVADTGGLVYNLSNNKLDLNNVRKFFEIDFHKNILKYFKKVSRVRYSKKEENEFMLKRYGKSEHPNSVIFSKEEILVAKPLPEWMYKFSRKYPKVV